MDADADADTSLDMEEVVGAGVGSTDGAVVACVFAPARKIGTPFAGLMYR